jgi:hypothetical protein
MVVVTLPVLLSTAFVRADDQPVPVLPGVEPQVAVAPDGGVFVVAGRDGVIAVASSTDGKTFGPPVTVARVEKLALGMRRGPRIATTEKSIVVAVIGTHEGVEGSLLSYRSTDGGATWQGPVCVNTQPRSAREGLHALAAGPKNEVACVWLDDRNKTKEVFAAVSDDGGATWKKDGLVYRSPDGHVCECCHPSVAFNAKGEVAVMFRNWLDGARDLWLVTSKDHGKTWAKALKLGAGSWTLNACPMDGGAIGSVADGSFISAWRRDQEVFVASAGKPEKSLGRGAQPWLAAGSAGVYAVWLEHRGGDVLFLAPGAKRVAKIGSNADDPVVAARVDGKGPVVAVWASGQNVLARVVATQK